MTQFLTTHGYLWVFLGVPIGIWGAAAVTVQIVLGLRARLVDEQRLLARLSDRVTARRVHRDLNDLLSDEDLLPFTLERTDQSHSSSIADVYENLSKGKGVNITGPAGSGKSVLALSLVARSIQAREQDAKLPLVDIVYLARWRAPLLRRNWQGLHNWVAGELARTYPGFGRRYFRSLLLQQALVPCLDGLDETTSSQRPSLARCLTSAASVGVPVAILGREIQEEQFERRSLIASPWRDRGGTSQPYLSLSLLPLSWNVAVSQLERRSYWPHLSEVLDGRPRLARELRNPMFLRVVTLTWDAGRLLPGFLAGNEPERQAWRAFVKSRVGRTTSTRTRQRLEPEVRSIATLMLQREQQTFHAFEANFHPLASDLVSLLALLALVSVLPAETPIFDAGAITTAWYTFHRITVPRRWDLLALPARLFPVLSRAALTAITNALAFVALTLLFFEFGKRVLGEVPRGESYLSHMHLNIHSLVYYATIAGGVGYLLTSGVPWSSPSEDISGRVGSKIGVNPGALRFIALAAIVLGTALGNGLAIFLGFCFAAGWLLQGASVFLGVAEGDVRAFARKKSCRELCDAGILTSGDGRSYRFRHQNLASVLARDGVAELAETHRLWRLPKPWAIIEASTLDESVTDQQLVESDRVTSYLVRRYPNYESLAVNRYLQIAFGALDPRRAEHCMRVFMATHGGSVLGAAAAEALDMQGRHDEAKDEWERVLSRGFRAQSRWNEWVRYRWVRREVQFGEPQRARNALLEQADRASESASDLWRVLAAEIDARMSKEDLARARETLAHLCESRSATVATRAALEISRILVEIDRDYRSAEACLTTLTGGALGCARYAQALWGLDRHEDARALASEGVQLASWAEDPTHQLEVMATSVAMAADNSIFATTRATRLLTCHWTLRHRPDLGEFFETTGHQHRAMMLRVFHSP